MPRILLLLGGLLASLAASIVARVLISLGIGVVSYIGMGAVLDFMFGEITAAVNTLPATVLHLAALMKLDVAINIIMGAVNARLGMVSLNGIVSRFQIDPAKYQTPA
jgi:hypothetical protein